MANPTQREQVFFSYSRKDKKWLELFQSSLRPLIRANQFSVWDDTKIKAGDVWRDEIKQALASAKVAVLLVSRNFLASDFIAENELPPLLEAAQNEGLKILLVVVGHSLFEETEIGRYQAVNDPSRPLAAISAANREKEIVRICREIKAAATLETPKKVYREAKGEVDTVLFLAASMKGQVALIADRELREIRDAVYDGIQLEKRTITKPQELGEALLQLRPRIVHFSGHSTSEGKLVLIDDSGERRVVGLAELASLFKLVTHQVECVVLNVAHSSTVAEAIAEEIKYVVAFNTKVNDTAAIAFAEAFYKAISFGRTIREAYEFGCGQLHLLNESDNKPILVVKR